MENEVSTASKSKMPVILIAAVVVIIIIGVVVFAMSKKSEESSESAAGEQMENQAVTSPTVAPTSVMMEKATYKDGTYKAEGDYVSPGGAESLDVSLTLKNGTVTDAIVKSNAFRPTSKQMQASFISGYKEQVVGKKIDEIHLTKVAASSLAPKGFNDAVEKIKAQAKAQS